MATNSTIANANAGVNVSTRTAYAMGRIGFMVLGVIYMIYLYRTNPGRVTDVGLVHLDALEETS